MGLSFVIAITLTESFFDVFPEAVAVAVVTPSFIAVMVGLLLFAEAIPVGAKLQEYAEFAGVVVTRTSLLSPTYMQRAVKPAVVFGSTVIVGVGVGVGAGVVGEGGAVS